MQGDTSTSSTRTSSLTVQLQQAWLHTQIPKVSKPLPLAKSFSTNRSPKPSPPPQVSSPPASSFSSRYSGRKPENLSNLSAIRSSSLFSNLPALTSVGSDKSSSSSSVGGGSDISSSEGGPGWITSSTVSLDSSGSAGFPDWRSPELRSGGDGDPWGITSPTGTPASKVLPELPNSKLARFASSDSYSVYIHAMLNDDALSRVKCMAHESMAYQAVHNELADIIGTFGSQADCGQGRNAVHGGTLGLPNPPKAKAQQQHSVSEDVEIWIDSLLNAPPPVIPSSELQDESGGNGISTTAVSDAFLKLTDASDDGSCFHSTLERQLPPVQMPDLNELLIHCAEAVAADDVLTANSLVGEIRQYSSPYGNGVERLAHYFTEGLVARLSGSGADLFAALNNRPTALQMVRAYHMFQRICPYFSLGHMFSNTSLLKVFEGASRVHIVDYGILYGFQWPPFIQDLANRPGGPPRLRITGIDFPQPGFKPAARLEETGKRLADYANLWGVPFEFQAVASKWENVQPAALGLRHDEVLAVSCIYRLRHLLDESVMPSCPRKVVLNRIRSMNPAVFVTAVLSASYNVPFFLSRFRECLDHYSYTFDALDSVVPRDCDVRTLLEREILGREILNVVACEGMERVERPEAYTSWQRRLQNAGFKMLPLDNNIMDDAKDIMKEHHKDFGIAQDGGWMLLGWKNQVVKGLGVWEPAG